MAAGFAHPTRLARLIALLASLALVVALVPGRADAQDDSGGKDFDIADEHAHRIDDVDRRGGEVAPTAAQRAIASDLGATAQHWNAFGTPHLLVNHGGYLTGPRAGSAEAVARAFVAEHADLFRLSDGQVAELEVVADTPLHDAPDIARVRDGLAPANADVAHVVLFRQTFDGTAAANDGLLGVGVQSDGRIATVWSSVTGDEQLQGSRVLSAVEALRAAAADVGFDLGALTEVESPRDDFTAFASDVVDDVQRARLRALPTPTDGVRLVWEATLLDGAPSDDRGGNPLGVISYVDAETGRVWLRTNRVDHVEDGGDDVLARSSAAPEGGPFEGATGRDGTCGERHPFTVTSGQGRIDVAVQTTEPSQTDGFLGLPVDDDLTMNLYFGDESSPRASQDLLTSPEVLSHAPSGEVEAGTWSVEVCPFNSTAGPIAYAGFFSASMGSPVSAFDPPRWRVFPTNPNFPDEEPSADVRKLWCWIDDTDTCDEEQANIASRVPWDYRPDLGEPTFTTDGNNASTAISEASFLTPDTVYDRPIALDRAQDHAWDNAWFENRCDPTAFSPAGAPLGDTGVDNDEAASVTNLFVQHNRVHDWAYFKGFTERTFNAQYDNFGNTPRQRENDPELGSAQAGRRTLLGRDNANQITLQDGIPPITNQYLWQPLAGAFYGTCTDGAYDAAIVLHEYHHLVTNRMIAGPDTGTGDSQGQTESWSDLGFAAYFMEFGLEASPNANRFALAPYVTGNTETGIRNYAMNDSPLNYSGLEYDGNGTTSPHAPGEIWSAVNFDVATALNDKYDATYPSDDLELQERCARGERAAEHCPGNVRWAQIMYDAFLVQPAGASMVVSRDAMLAADMLRFDGANQAELWEAFARRGLGATAFSDGVDDVRPSPGWTSPLRDDNGTVTFVPSATDGGPDPQAVQVFVGDYEARISPVADTDPETKNTADRQNFDETESFVPGTYEAIARADGFGAHRFTFEVRAGKSTRVDVPMPRNLASGNGGATATGDGEPDRVPMLIDDTEATNWESLTSAGTASAGKGEGRQVEGRQVTVDLVGDEPHLIDSVQVSAALIPASDNAGESQSRFSALRSFEIWACDVTTVGSCDEDVDFTRVLASADDAFPAGQPRPLAPDLTLRPFDVDDTTATHVRLVVIDNQCTGGPAYQDDQDNDPAFHSDCDAEPMTPDRALLAPPFDQVRAAELQVFGVEDSGPGRGNGRPGGSSGLPDTAVAR